MKVVTIIMGVLLVVSGIYCMLSPVATYAALGWVIGASMVIEGVASIVMWNSYRKLGLANGWMLAESILSLVLGVFLLGSNTLQYSVDMFIAYLIALWLVFAGIARIVMAVSARGSLGRAGSRGWIGQVVLGVLVIILGILCIYNPTSIMASVGLMLGISDVLVGVGFIVAGSEM